MSKFTLSVKEMAEMLNISLPKAYELTKQEDFPVLMVGNRILIPHDAFMRWVEKNTTQGSVNN
ncbi:helix-turn-helix domain-containing protein [Christensenellaceae bacterium OttesenSCG-928-K19]|nr:helix-turn-helix domain-containing protein [Christensenellaceae bacterium OttesenSCG-928-K19]